LPVGRGIVPFRNCPALLVVIVSPTNNCSHIVGLNDLW
jgi:hypothetical protein